VAVQVGPPSATTTQKAKAKASGGACPTPPPARKTRARFLIRRLLVGTERRCILTVEAAGGTVQMRQLVDLGLLEPRSRGKGPIASHGSTSDCTPCMRVWAAERSRGVGESFRSVGISYVEFHLIV
jgi:hypothetical protein